MIITIKFTLYYKIFLLTYGIVFGIKNNFNFLNIKNNNKLIN